MNKFNHTIKENKDTTILQFNINELENLPIKVAIKTLEILEKNNRTVGRFVEFDKETQEFIDKNKNLYIEETQKENENFKKISQLYFNEMSGPLYIYGDRVIKLVAKIYDFEQLVIKKESIKIPKVIYSLKKENDSNFNKVLDVKNTNELIDTFGQAFVLHSLILFKDSLNYEYQVKNKTRDIPYGISREIIRACFNKEKNQHARLEDFKDENYQLEQIFNNQSKMINSPEEIIELLLIREDLKLKLIENINESKKLKIK